MRYELVSYSALSLLHPLCYTLLVHMRLPVFLM
jgi:hypothetical protein